MKNGSKLSRFEEEGSAWLSAHTLPRGVHAFDGRYRPVSTVNITKIKGELAMLLIHIYFRIIYFHSYLEYYLFAEIST